MLDPGVCSLESPFASFGQATESGQVFNRLKELMASLLLQSIDTHVQE